jgi:DNA primase
MKTTDQIKALKQVSIVNYLRGKGINPTSKKGKCYLYLSPLRDEKTASFSVDTERNTFLDFGNSNVKTTSIIDLVMLMENVSFPDACKILEGIDGEKKTEFGEENLSLLTVNTSSKNSVKDYQITAVKDLQHPALIRYVESRQISFKTTFMFLREIHYTNSKGKFFGVGYETDNGGYVLRSEIMQKPMNLGKTGIKTFVVPESKEITIFEGMFDFLACVELCKRPPRCTAIVLNSVSNLSKAMPQLSEATEIYSYMDNDTAGRKATQKMKDSGLNVFDKSAFYEGYKDFSEFWEMRNKPP